MRQVQYDQSSGCLRVSHCKRPGNESSPVMPDNRGLWLFEMIHHGLHIANQLISRVMFNPLGLIALVVSSLVDGHDVEMFCQGRDLIAPGIPEIRKPMDQDYQGTLACFHVVDFYA